MAKRHFCKPFRSFSDFFATLIQFIPIISWLPNYSIKEYLIADIIGGLTVGIMHVPQGIAYSSLAGVTPVVGLYMSFLAPLFYMVLGTSRHTSLGSFAVVSLMCGVAVERVLSEKSLASEIIIYLTFLLFQILMGMFRLQFLATYFSDQVVAGFTTAASCHVFVSQLKEVFYVRGQPRHSGFGQLFLQLYDIVRCIGQVNLYTLLVTFCSIVFLLIGKELINPWIKRKRLSPVPVPFELLLISFRLPSPHLPHMNLVADLLVDGVQIALVIIAVHISMAKMFAKKLLYKVDPGQELYAIGATSILSSFFPVYPISCSLGRTVTNVNAGTKTQLSSIFSSALLLAIIAYFGQFLSALPMCVLSSVVIVALLKLFGKIADLRKLWPISKLDCSIWMVSFLGTVIYDVKIGLAVSIAYALLTTVFRTQCSKLFFSGLIGIYYRICRIRMTTETYIIIFRFDSPLLFTNVERFKEVIYKVQSIIEHYELSYQTIFVYKVVGIFVLTSPSNLTSKQQPLHFIIDCSGFTFVDYMGVNALKEIFSEMHSEGFLVYFASAKAPVREMFASSGFYAYVPKGNFYPTIRDAVSIAKQRHMNNLLKFEHFRHVPDSEGVIDELHSSNVPLQTLNQ
uniref:STAS domain-containing protein n=1 Tax=Syphacia muris TaxID=451379 RepID=A0A158R3W4_9BILA